MARPKQNGTAGEGMKASTPVGAKTPSSVLQIKQVVIRPLKRKTWSGFQRFPKCQDTIIARKTRGGYVTGLKTEEARELERLMRLPDGELDPNSSYWKSFAFRLTDKDTILDMSIPIDIVNLRMALSDPRVAASVTSKHLSPKAEYVVYDIVEDAKHENLKIEKEVEAASVFAKLSIAEQAEFLKLMGIYAESTAPSVIKNRLYKAVKEDPNGFLAIANLQDKDTRLLILDLTRNNILRLQGGHYMHGTVDIGFDLDSAVQYMKDPNNQDLRLNLMEQLESVNRLA